MTVPTRTHASQLKSIQSAFHADGNVSEGWRDHLLLVGDHIKAATGHLLLAVSAFFVSIFQKLTSSCNAVLLGCCQSLCNALRAVFTSAFKGCCADESVNQPAVDGGPLVAPRGILFPTGPLKERWDLLIMTLILYSATSVPVRICFNAEA